MGKGKEIKMGNMEKQEEEEEEEKWRQSRKEGKAEKENAGRIFGRTWNTGRGGEAEGNGE